MDASTEQRPFWEVIWPVLACGAGLFSDGYVNNVRLGRYPGYSRPRARA